MSEALFLRLLAYEHKSSALTHSIKAASEGNTLNSNVHVVDPASFSQIPGSTFAYWVSECIRRKFIDLPPFESQGREVRVGDHPGDGFRYLRLFWEVPTDSSTLDWRPYQKGGKYSPFYCDIHLVADWDASRQTYRDFHGRPGRLNERPSNYQYFFRPGLTWPRRTTSGISIRVLPKGCIFADKGPAAFADTRELQRLLALMNSQAFESLVALQLGAADAAARSYEVGLIQKVPVPNLSGSEGLRLSELAMSCVDLKRALDTANEISHIFYLPALLQVTGNTLNQHCAAWQTVVSTTEQQLANFQHEIDDIAFNLYNIDDIDRHAIKESLERNKRVEGNKAEEVDIEDEDHDSEASIDAGRLVVSLLSYAVGCVYGRWDIRFATHEGPVPVLPDPFAPLPACSPGMLIGHDGLPQRETPHGYLLTINWEGILVDDPGHHDDIVQHSRNVLSVIWRENADAIEQEACQILGVKDLRDYFHRSGNDGFWMDHVKRYSKSRRKAPIYWLLQSSKRNYSLWLYYHRLDKDILFKALTNYVEPKLRLEEGRLVQLRTQLAGAGSAGREVKQLEKQLERQESLMAELYDFRDKLRRAADLQLVPDLNDGVVLNIAPLWELVPWSEARRYWEELREGKYEWSSISKQLRERKVI
jgi:hypothetical protein